MHRTILLGALCAFLFLGCSSQKGLVGTSALKAVKPVKQLEPDENGFPVNLVVRATNIADFSYSNKNKFELFVNDKLVRPRNKVHNGSRTYVYHLKLLPGYYKVEGIYHWHDGTRKVKTPVTTRELVKIEPRQRTILKVAMEKDWRGILLNERPLFDVSYEPIEETVAAAPVRKVRFGGDEAVEAKPENRSTRPVASPEAPDGARPSDVSIPEKASLPAEHLSGATVAESPLPPDARSAPKVRLQINTVPDNCDIIIDDEMVGQSPLSVWVTRNRSHVVQIKHPDYKSVIRFIDQEKLRSRDQMIVIERLEAEEQEASDRSGQ